MLLLRFSHVIYSYDQLSSQDVCGDYAAWGVSVVCNTVYVLLCAATIGPAVWCY